VVAQPWRRAEKLVTLWLCVAPLRLGGLRGKKSTPSVWLGGTGEFIAVGEQEQRGVGTARSSGRPLEQAYRQRYAPWLIHRMCRMYDEICRCFICDYF
jgi:hypothetical protein